MSLTVFAKSQHARRVTHGDRPFRQRFRYDGTGTDHALLSYIRHDERSVADPTVAADCDSGEFLRLLANRDVHPFDAGLAAPRMRSLFADCRDPGAISELEAEQVIAGLREMRQALAS